jgi:hypothetical protein
VSWLVATEACREHTKSSSRLAKQKFPPTYVVPVHRYHERISRRTEDKKPNSRRTDIVISLLCGGLDGKPIYIQGNTQTQCRRDRFDTALMTCNQQLCPLIEHIALHYCIALDEYQFDSASKCLPNNLISSLLGPNSECDSDSDELRRWAKSNLSLIHILSIAISIMGISVV